MQVHFMLIVNLHTYFSTQAIKLKDFFLHARQRTQLCNHLFLPSNSSRGIKKSPKYTIPLIQVKSYSANLSKGKNHPNTICSKDIPVSLSYVRFKSKKDNPFRNIRY